MDHTAHPPRTRVFHTGGGRFALGGCLLERTAAHQAPGLSVDEPPSLSRFCLNYVLEGSGTYETQRGMSYEIGPGTAFHRLPGRRHRTVIEDSPYLECYFHFSGSLYRALRWAGCIRDENCVSAVSDSVRALKACQEVYEVLNSDWAGPWNEVMRRLIVLLSATTEQDVNAKPTPAWIVHARSFITRNADERITAAEMAEHVNMSETTFRREFRHHTGCPPGRFLIRRRIDCACNLLRTNTVKSVAYQLGYPDPKTFSKQFHKYVGMPPSQFQRQELGR